MRFLTGMISSSNSPPSASSTSSGFRASGNPSVSRGNSIVWVWLWELGSCIASSFRLDELEPTRRRRAVGVLPGQAEEVETRDIGDAATVAGATALIEDRQLDPRVVGPVARRPD